MRILVVSPHPDDETLGAGGTLLKEKKKNNDIFWLNVTDISIDSGWDKEIVEHRKAQISQVKEYYNFSMLYNLKFTPTTLSEMSENKIIEEFRHVLNDIKPEWIILPGQYDAHSDHHVVYKCCMACTKAFRLPYIKRITTMEILSETEYGFQNDKFIPNFYVDISDELEGKINAMKIYDSEIDEVPFPRSIENIKALATYRGCSCGRRYAEAFYIVKSIE